VKKLPVEAVVNAAAGDGTTPLMLAALGGHLEAAAFLVSRGAQVNVKNKAGWTPLIAAAAVGKVLVLV
jgi:ankyrin repeat protein